MKKYSDNSGVGFYKGYDIFMGFCKWKIAKDTVERYERFDTYFDAIDFIEKNLVKKTIDIQEFISHADNIKTMEMKKVFLTLVGQKCVEQNVILSNLFYVSYGDHLLLVPFHFMRNGKIITQGVNLFNFLKDNKLIKVKEIFKKDVTILNSKVIKNNMTIYDCALIDWETLLNKKLIQNFMKDRISCPLDN